MIRVREAAMRNTNPMKYIILALSTCALTACGDDGGSSRPDGDGSGGATPATGGTGGATGGTGGMAPAGDGVTGGMTAVDTGPVTCGGVECTTDSINDDVTLCCTDFGSGVAGDEFEARGRANDLCGLNIPSIPGACIEIDQPGDVDDRCPDISYGWGEVVQKGCCTEAGLCGGFDDLVEGNGLGCTYPTNGAVGAESIPCDPDDRTPSITCGGVECFQPYPGRGIPCCTVEGTGVSGDANVAAGRDPDVCGLEIPTVAGACLQIDQPGDLDDTCPSMDYGSAEPNGGCCTEQGLCGTWDLEFYGLGCTYPTGARAEADMEGIPCGN